MKKIFLTALAAGLLLQANAKMGSDSKDLAKYRFSLFAGFNTSTFKPTSTTASNYNVSCNGTAARFTFGINAEKPFTEKYSLFSGVSVDWRGGGMAASHDSTFLSDANYLRNAVVFYKTQYVTVPLGLKMQAVEIEKIGVKINALAAADLGILISQKGDNEAVLFDNSKVTNAGTSLRSINRTNPISLGWNIGVGGEYKLKSDNAAYVQLLYRNGILDATLPTLNTAGLKYNDGNVRTNHFIFRVGYYF